MTLHLLPEFTHERVTTAVGRRSGLTMAVALHSSALGPGLGGCRMWRYGHWSDGLGDVLRLSAAMTLKNALADIGYGGGKAVIALGPDDELDAERRTAALHDMGDLVEQFDGAYITAEDVGTTEHDMLVVHERTRHVVGLPPEEGGEGEPADGTALGVFVSIERAFAELDGRRDLSGRRIIISGLGQVGGRLARRLAAAGASLAVTDIVASRRALAEEIGADWIDVDAALTTPGDLFVPAGLGGVLTDETIDALPVRAVVGPANNPLADRCGAARLAARGILYAPDFLVNAGGVIHLALASKGAS
ncbi:MAG: Glu/Leu/Phe/Val dehydrogenase dimerization domain-containing protein, partial [Microcella sp.]